MLFTDQLGNQIDLPHPPQRIISLVPSQTELLFDLGLGERIVGVTKFCIHPKEATRTKSIIGGTKNFRFDVIDQLRPDLIIGNKEENYKEGIEALQQKYPVWVSDIFNLEDSLHMMQALGQVTDTAKKANEISVTIQKSFDVLQPLSSALRVAYFIWRNPYMGVGKQTFIDDILLRCGFRNVLGHLNRYPEITSEMLRQADPQLILLSSEPYPFQEKHITEFQAICPKATIQLVDGEMFSWYGSRLLEAPVYLQQLLEEISKSL